GAGEQRRRDFEAERLGGFRIDHELEFDRCLDRQLGWPFAAENAVEIGPRAPDDVDLVGSIGYQATAHDRVTKYVDRRHAMAGRDCSDHIPMQCRKSIGGDEQAAVGLPREHFNLILYLVSSPYEASNRLDLELRGRVDEYSKIIAVM